MSKHYPGMPQYRGSRSAARLRKSQELLASTVGKLPQPFEVLTRDRDGGDLTPLGMFPDLEAACVAADKAVIDGAWEAIVRPSYSLTPVYHVGR